jgi:hypothetical protein
MANNAMIIAVDRINFTWPKSKKMRIYAVGIAADNRGKVLVTEPPGSVELRHMPKADRPACWDFGGDGYPIYQRTGGLADIVVAHLLIVRSRARARRAGEIVQAVAASSAATSAVEQASAALKQAKNVGIAAATSLSLVLPVVELVGQIIGKQKDTVLQTISGSMFLDKERKLQDSFTQTIRSPDGNMEVEADVFLFNGKVDKDSVAETDEAEVSLQADHLLFVKNAKK